MKLRQQLKIFSDISAIDFERIDTWSSQFIWPVSDAEYQELTEKILSLFYDIISKQDELVRRILLCDFNFVVFLIQHFHSRLVIKKAPKAGCNLIAGELAKSVYDPDWSRIASVFQIPFGKINIAKFFAKNSIYYAGHVKKFSNVMLKKAVVFGSRSDLLDDTIEKYDAAPIYLYADLYMNLSSIQEKQDFDARPVGELLSEINVLIEKTYGFSLDREQILHSWKRRSQDLFSIYQRFFSSRLVTDRFYFNQAANPIHRTAATAFSLRGKQTIALSHGNNFGWMLNDAMPFTECASYTDFILPTQSAAKTFDDQYHNSKFQNLTEVAFVSVETQYYEKLYWKSQKEVFPEQFRKIMIVGFPMNANRYLYSPGCFFAFQLDLEYRLIHLLHSRGYEVLYKIHPDRYNEAVGLFHRMNVTVVREPFERSWRLADTFIFKYSCTSTFGYALCTNRPILLFDIEKPFWRPDHFNLIKSRCHMISSEQIADNNRIEFDQEALLSILENEPQYPDFSYVYRHMFPRGIAEAQ